MKLTLAEMKAKHLPHAQASDMMTLNNGDQTIVEEGTEKVLEVIDDYLKNFAKYQPNCIRCDAEQTGLIAQMLGQGFTWGLAYGEGFCQTCKWPGRGMHYVKDDSGKEVFTMRNFVLQYHPDVLEEPTK